MALWFYESEQGLLGLWEIHFSEEKKRRLPQNVKGNASGSFSLEIETSIFFLFTFHLLYFLRFVSLYMTLPKGMMDLKIAVNVTDVCCIFKTAHNSEHGPRWGSVLCSQRPVLPRLIWHTRNTWLHSQAIHYGLVSQTGLWLNQD